MFVNIINKHGLMPKKSFPDTVSSEGPAKLYALLYTKVIFNKNLILLVEEANFQELTRMPEKSFHFANSFKDVSKILIFKTKSCLL